MDYSNTSRSFTSIKTLVFSFLLALSWGSFAQEDTSTDSQETVAVEVEQININHADATTIARVLDGIGMSRAEAIVSFRETYGDFTSMEDLMLVKGVGEVTVRNNENRIRFEQ